MNVTFLIHTNCVIIICNIMIKGWIFLMAVAAVVTSEEVLNFLNN